MLVVGRWLLAVLGCWLFVVGCLLAIGVWLLVVRSPLFSLVVRCRL